MSSEQLNSLEKRTAVSLALIFSMRMLGLFMLMPILAIYGQDLSGVSPLWIGLAIGAYGLTQALLQIPMGWLSDRYGRKRVIVAGLVVFAIGSVIAGLAQSIEMVTLGRAIQGMGAIASAILALASDLTREEQRTKVMAVIGMCIGLSFALALVLGPMIANSYGLPGVFFATAIMAFAGILVVLTLVPNSHTTSNTGEVTASLAGLSKMFVNPQLLRLDYGVLVLHLMMTSLFIAIPLKLVKTGLAIDDHWLVYLPVLLVSFVFMVPMIIVAAKKSLEKQMFMAAIGLLVLASAQMIFDLSFSMICIALLIFFVGFNFLEASLPAHVSRMAPAGEKGSAMGVYSSSQFLGAFLGGLLGGYVAQNWGFSYLFAANAAVAVSWIIVASGMVLPARSNRVSIPLSTDTLQDYQGVVEAISRSEGVMEATLIEDENRIYLKVDKANFDKEKVEQLVNSYS